MASTDIREFLFYFKYLWSPADFLNLQTWLQETTAGIAEGAFGASVLSGLLPTPGGGLNVSIAAGISVGDTGQLMVNGSATPTPFTAPLGAPKKSLLVMRPTITPTTVIPQPDNPSNNVPLHQILGFIFVVIDGVESVTPVYPSKAAGDVIVCGVGLTPGQSTIAASDIDRSPISVQRKKVHALRKQTGNYNIQATDDHIDYDTSGGAATATFPSSQIVPGQDYTVVKTDSSANPLTITGTDLFSGQSNVILDTQWQSVTVRSVGINGWRVL